MKYVLYVLATIGVIDILGFTIWVASGQFPVDSFYVGTLTAHLLGLFV